MRTAKVLDRLKAEQAKNPDVPHYDSMGTPWPQPPSDVKTAGYWKLEAGGQRAGNSPAPSSSAATAAATTPPAGSPPTTSARPSRFAAARPFHSPSGRRPPHDR